MHGNKNHHLNQKSTSFKFSQDQTLIMKVHQFTPGIWDHHEPVAFLSHGCKRLRPLTPRLTTSNNDPDISALDLKSFIRPETSPRRIEDGNDSNPHVHFPRVETHPEGTRWNPTQEQIEILEMLYGRGMRTPNAQQIEQITLQLGKYGKIKGKNVFYWFQNHKARERQKQKCSGLAYTHFPHTLKSISALSCGGGEERMNGEDDSPCKRKSRSWGAKFSQVCGDEGKTNSSRGEEDGSSVVLKTLELFPLRPEGR